VEGYENWLCYGLSGDISIDLNCIFSGHAGQFSVIANGMWSSFIVLSVSASPTLLEYKNGKKELEHFQV